MSQRECVTTGESTANVILVVDDDDTIRRLAAHWLREDDSTVIEVGSGVEALELIRAEPERVAVVVLDVMMPELDGFEVLSRLQASPDTAQIPVVLLTAHATTEADVLRGIEQGAFDHVEKPFRGPLLKARVRALKKQRQAALSIRNQLDDIESQAREDGLTRLGNRRHFDASLAREVAHAARHSEPLCLVLMDLDYFKSINDLFGHSQGDRVLTHFANEIRESLRCSDEAFRIGGEEFALILRHTHREDAKSAIRRLKSVMADAPLDLGGGEHRRVTFSAGIASMEEDNEFRAEGLFDRADKALYRAKHAGRNRIELEGDAP
ncbi:MAG: diguanylate cyclase [Myxococcales bacterium]|nr:diguanylate cyclase [Myxococcales bacterium]MCB9576422.1 diguanylate cyclase [Polyangiaceae bacterium]